MPHPVEINVAAVVSELLRGMTPNWYLESQLFASMSGAGLWDREEFEAGLQYAQRKGWVMRASGRVKTQLSLQT